MKQINSKYQYPVGDFLSGFSDNPNNPCDYELECQRMTIRGVMYFDEHPELIELIKLNSLKITSPLVKPLIDFMMLDDSLPKKKQGGQTGAMVSQSVGHAYQAKVLGWQKYIETIQKNQEEDQ